MSVTQPYKSEYVNYGAIIKEHSIIRSYIERNKDLPELRSLLANEPINKTSLARLASVGYSVVHRTDMFLYDGLPPSLAAVMCRYDAQPKIDWESEYLNEKINVLHAFKDIFESHSDSRIGNWLTTDPNDYTMTWTEWRESVAPTQMEFARMMLMNPSILQHYEEGITQNLPVVIRERLLFYGMEPRFVHALNERMV